MYRHRILRWMTLLLVLSSGVFFMFGSALGGGPAGAASPSKPLSKSEHLAQLEGNKKFVEAEITKLQSDWHNEAEKMLNPDFKTQAMDVVTSGKASDWHQFQHEKKQVDLEYKISQKKNELKWIERKIDELQNESTHSCFPKETQILMADGTLKPIEDVTLNERVMTYDIAKDSLSSSPIKHIYISPNNHYYTLNNTVKATAYERFLTPMGWKKIRDIEPNDTVFDGNHFTTIVSIKKVEDMLTVYNLNIDTSHNFFVSKDGQTTFLVHNSGGGGGK